MRFYGRIFPQQTLSSVLLTRLSFDISKFGNSIPS